MCIYFVKYSENGRRKYWHESLNAKCAAALAAAMLRKGMEPEIILVKGDAKTLTSALSTCGTSFLFQPPFAECPAPKPQA